MLVALLIQRSFAIPALLEADWSTNMTDIVPQVLQTSADGTIHGSVCQNGFTTAIVGFDQLTGTRVNEIATTNHDTQAVKCILITAGQDVADSVAARWAVDALNDAIYNTIETVKIEYVDDADRINFVSMTEPNSPFNGHDICAVVPAFVYPAATDPVFEIRNWFHPNNLGHTFYEEVISANMNQS